MEAGAPNATGWWKGSIAPGCGGIVTMENYVQDGYGQFMYAEPKYTIDLSRASSVYGSSNTITPLSVKTKWFIKY